MKRLLASLRRWWRFLRLVRGAGELALSTTHSTRAAREQAAWERVAKVRGIRRTTPLPRPRRAKSYEGNVHA